MLCPDGLYSPLEFSIKICSVLFNDQSFNDALTNNILVLNNWALEPEHKAMLGQTTDTDTFVQVPTI